MDLNRQGKQVQALRAVTHAKIFGQPGSMSEAAAPENMTAQL